MSGASGQNVGARVRRWIALLACATVWVAFPSGAEATPWMGLQAGTPCSTCHVNVQGGGARTEIGWGASAYLGMVQWDDVGFDWLANQETNRMLGGYVSEGGDIRMQSARVGAPPVERRPDGSVKVGDPPREFFLMQLQPHLTVHAHEMLDVYGTWAFSRGEFIRDRDACVEPYAGQSCYEAMAIFRPGGSLPLVRVGMMQPSIGIRHDDHTMLIRDDVSAAPVIPANYAELGGEVTWRPVNWVTLDAGLFRAQNLSESLGGRAGVGEDSVAWSSRLAISPLLGTERNLRFSTLVGGSVYGAEDFLMENAFVGVGWLDRASLLLEAAFLQYGGPSSVSQDGMNLGAQLEVPIQSWLIAQARIERGRMERPDRTFETVAWVGGLQWFPIPYVELRPEYRRTKTDRAELDQFAFQLHLFY